MASSTAPAMPRWHAQELQLLEALIQRLGEHGDPDPLMQAMLQQMDERLGLVRGRIVLVPPDGGPARIRLAHGLTDAETARGIYRLGEGVTGHVLATGQAMVVQDVDAEPRFLARSVPREQLPREPQAFLALPIQVGPRTVGVLACHRSVQPGRALDEDLALLRILAALAGQRLQAGALPRGPLVRPYLSADSHTAEALLRALADHGGHQGHAARALGLTLRQFNYRLRKARGGD